MKRLAITLVSILLCAPAAARDKYVLISHSDGTNVFWQVLAKGAFDAAKVVGADLEFRHPNRSADAVAEAQIIDAAVAQKVDGLIITILDPDVVGPAVQRAVDAGIPVITANAGGKFSRKYGALYHVGQDEYVAGKGAGDRAKAAGVTNHICFVNVASNISLRERCQGYAEAVGAKPNIVEATSDPTEGKARASAALTSNKGVNGVVVTDPVACMAIVNAITELGLTGKISVGCFDNSKDVSAAIEDGRVAFAIDQQQYMQGYYPVIGLDLYRKYGLVPGANVLTGPGFVTKENVQKVKALAGNVR